MYKVRVLLDWKFSVMFSQNFHIFQVNLPPANGNSVSVTPLTPDQLAQVIKRDVVKISPRWAAIFTIFFSILGISPSLEDRQNIYNKTSPSLCGKLKHPTSLKKITGWKKFRNFTPQFARKEEFLWPVNEIFTPQILTVLYGSI